MSRTPEAELLYIAALYPALWSAAIHPDMKAVTESVQPGADELYASMSK
jgi:hypothetical protein